MTQKSKQRFTPFLLDQQSLSNEFSTLLEALNAPYIKEGSVVKGQVVGVDKEVIILDVGLKNEGRIPKSEFRALDADSLPKIGDMVDVFVEKLESLNGRTILSREKAIREESWVDLEAACESRKCVEGVIFGRVKGGLTVELTSGVIAFLPGSQVDVKPVKDVSALMGVNLQFHILKMDRELGNIVVSRRTVLEESRSEARDEMLATISEGTVLEGFVKNITDYGAFIDLGSVDGLLHVTDIAWSRVNHPSEVLSIGQKVKVMVIKYQPETKRISLGMKYFDANPWENIKAEFPVGQIFTGKVSNIADYGAFVELKDGIEGLVHSSEISWLRSQNPKKLLTIGQDVEFKVLEIDPDKHRISMSIKQCTPNPLIKFSENNPVGTVIKAPIRNITDFGMFVAVEDNIDGMIHESDISRDGNGAELLKSYSKGDIIECKVLSIDVDKERISLGIKQLREDSSEDFPSEEFKKGKVVTCIVSAVNEDGIEVKLSDDLYGSIKRADLSSDKADQKVDRFAIGDRLDAKVIAINKQKRTLSLSIKALELDEREKAIKDYGSTDSGASLGDILGSALGDFGSK
jgi:small subunit ribosomal protein S1